MAKAANNVGQAQASSTIQLGQPIYWTKYTKYTKLASVDVTLSEGGQARVYDPVGWEQVSLLLYSGDVSSNMAMIQ